MSQVASPGFSVSALFAERAARRRQEQEAAEQMMRRREEELAVFRKRLETFQLTPEIIESGQQRIRRAFERGENEIMIASFPSEFCSDSARAIINVGAPPINEPTKEEAERMKDQPPEWLSTVPAGLRVLYDYWKAEMKPAGFELSARVINYPGGKPGEVGIFFTWPKSLTETQL